MNYPGKLDAEQQVMEKSNTVWRLFLTASFVILILQHCGELLRIMLKNAVALILCI